MKQCLISLISILLLATAAAAQDLTVIDNSGSGMVITAKGEMVSLKNRTSVAVGETVMVAGKGTVSLATPDGVVKVTAGSKSLMKNNGLDATGKLHIDVPKGTAHFKVVPGNKLDVKTPHMVASVRGTAFTAAVDTTGTDLSVSEGVVECTDNQGQNESVQAGSKVRSRTVGFDQESRERNRERNAAKNSSKNKNSSHGKSSSSHGKSGSSHGNSGGNSGNNGGGNSGGNGGGHGNGHNK